MRTQLAMTITLATLSAAALSCANERGHDGLLGSSSSAISNGTIDTSTYPYVFVSETWDSAGLPTETPRGCSAVLVTPRWVATAAHCVVEGATDRRDMDWTFSVTRTGSAIPERRVHHTKAVSGPVYALNTSGSYTNSHDARTDIAIMRLDDPGVVADIKPVHPAGLPGTPACSPPLTNTTIIGYGDTFDHENHWNQRRTFQVITDTNWVRDDEPGGGTGSFEAAFGGTYNGMLHGDSGGALVDNTTGNLCGIASFFNVTLKKSWYAAVDRPTTIAFLQPHLMPDGVHWDGECVGVGTDSDGDGIADNCDKCPWIRTSTTWPHEDQIDTDGDGKGDYCDNCTTVPNDQTNSTIAIDIEVAGDLAQPCGNGTPTTPLPYGCRAVNPATPTELEASWPGDACKPPMTVLATTGTGFDAKSERPLANLIVMTGEYCPPAGRAWRSVVKENVFTSLELTGGKDNLKGVTRLLSCYCPSTQTDLQCKGDPWRCDRSGSMYLPVGNWRSMSVWDRDAMTELTHKGTGSPPSHDALIYTTHKAALASGGFTDRRIAWAYWHDWADKLPTGTPSGASFEVFAGVVWPWVQGFGPTLSLGLDTLTIDGTERHRQAPIRIAVSEHGSDGVIPSEKDCLTYKPISVFDAKRLSIPKPVLEYNGGTKWYFTAPESGSTDASALIDSDLKAAILDPALRLVAASDVSGAWRGLQMGVIVNPTTHTLSKIARIESGMLRSASASSSPTYTQSTTAVVAVSGRRGEALFFGERDGVGQPMPSVRSVRLDDGTTSSRAFVSGPGLADPVAAAYRMEDDTYYVLDRAMVSGAPVMRLVSVTDAMATSVVAQWSRVGAYSSFALTAGETGSLVVSTWSTNGFTVSELVIDAWGVHLFNRVTSSSGGLALPAYRRQGGLYYAGTQGGVALRPQILEEAPAGPIANPSFETGATTGWTAAGLTSVRSDIAKAGTYSAQIGSTAPTGTSSLTQTFVVPAFGQSSLSFWYQMTCPDTVTYDWFTATLTDNTTSAQYTIVPRVCENLAVWRSAVFSLAGMAGHSVTLTLTNQDDLYPTDPTYTLVDDIRLPLDGTRDFLANSAFESGNLTGWTTTAGVAVTTDGAAGGKYHARVGTLTPSSVNTASQTVNIPSFGVTNLSFRYLMVCPDTVTYDWFTVTITDNTASQSYTVVPNTCVDDGVWRRVDYPLPSGMAGHNVTITFTNRDDAYPGDASFTYLDDVRLDMDPALMNGVF